MIEGRLAAAVALMVFLSCGLHAADPPQQELKTTRVLSPGEGFAAGGVEVIATSEFSGGPMFVLNDGCTLGNFTAIGRNIRGSAWKGVGPGPGAGVYGAGKANRFLSGLCLLKSNWKCFSNGVINLEYVKNVVIEDQSFEHVQTGSPGYNVHAALEMYKAQNVTIGRLQAKNYHHKAFSLSYLVNASVASIDTKGGILGHSSLHLQGGQGIKVNSVTHDGLDTHGYGVKAVDTKNLSIGRVSAANAHEALQCYGAEMTVGEITSQDHLNNCLSIDAYQVRDQEPDARVNFRCLGDIRSLRGPSSDTQANAVSLRSDNTRTAGPFLGDGARTQFDFSASPSGWAWQVANQSDLVAYVDGTKASVAGVTQIDSAVTRVTLASPPPPGAEIVFRDTKRSAPIERVQVDGTVYARGGFSGLFMTPTPLGEVGSLTFGGLDVDRLAPGGYVALLKGRKIRLSNVVVGSEVFNGIVLYTDTLCRNGKAEISGLKIPRAAASWTTEPVLRFGYPSGTPRECAFGTIAVDSVFVDGNNAPNLKLMEILAHGGKKEKKMTVALSNIQGRNLVVAEQILLDFADCSEVKLTLKNIDLRDAGGSPLGITIVSREGVVRAEIAPDVTCRVTYRQP